MNKIIQDYVLEREVGNGQYGQVYKAENRKNKVTYAVKAMKVEKFKETAKLKELTNNQVAILSKLNHENIIKFVEMIRTQKFYYLVYEFCNGGTLAQLIKKKKRLSQKEALAIFVQLRSAFQALYQEKVLHRDLKPTNILFQNGLVKIADFGFCKEMIKANEMTNTIVGSPIYMAPQILQGQVYDNRADLWSLGVILYQMLYGCCPYEQTSIKSLVKLIKEGSLKFPSQVHVSDNIKVLMKRLLTVKFIERMTPLQFFRYPIDIEVKSMTKLNSTQNIYCLKDVIIFHRKMILYLFESLSLLAGFAEDLQYAKFAFLVYKITRTIQKDTEKNSKYWSNLQLVNSQENWDFILSNQARALIPYGNMIREILVKNSPPPQIKRQFETNYIDPKYYMELIYQVSDQSTVKDRLMNCFLINYHFSTVMDKKTINFTDYTLSKGSILDKIEICQKCLRR